MTISNLHYVLARMAELKPQIDELANAEGVFEDEQRSNWERLTTEWDELDARRAELQERADRAAQAGAVHFNINTNPSVWETDLTTRNRSDILNAGLNAVEAMEHRFAHRDHGQTAARLIESGGATGELAARLAITTGSNDYREAWLAYMTGQAHDARILGRANDEYRAMTAGTGSSGGYMVPLYLDPTMVLTGAGSTNPFRQVSTIKTITTLTYNGASAAQVTAGLLGENAAFSDNAPTVAQIQIPTYKIGAYIPASFEAFEDIDALAEDVRMLFADAKDNYEATQMATGSGSAPKGVVTAVTAVTASRVAPTTGGVYAVADVYKVHAALPARFRAPNADNRAWVMNVGVIDATRQFGTANNYHGFLTDLGGGQPPRLLGDSLFESSTMSASVTTGQNIILYGDFSRFYIVDRIGLSTEFIPNVFDQSTGRPSGTRAWLCHWRFGSDCADPNAFRILLL